MLGMGATLSLSQFIAVFKDPRGLGLGLALQLLFVPAVAVAIVYAFDLGPGWAVGLCLVASVPGGAFSNLLTFLARGNTPLSIAVTVSSTALAMVTVPVILGIIASAYLPAEFEFPIHEAIVEIGAYLVIPLIVGMMVYRWANAIAETVAKWAIRASVALLVVITASSLGSGRITIWAYGWGPPLIILLFGVVVAVTTPHICRLLGRYDDDTSALQIEVTVRNVGIALLLVHFFFPGDDRQAHVLFTCLFYAGASGPIILPSVLAHRFGKPLVLLYKRRPR